MRVQALHRGWNPRSRPGGSRQWLSLLGDAALALVLAAGAVAVAVLRTGIPHRGAAVALAVLQTLPLVYRRSHPLPVLAVVTGASAAAAIISGTVIQPLSLLVALYTVAARCSRRDATRAGVATAVVLAWPLLRDSGYGIGVTVLKAGFLAAGWVFGAYLGELRARAAGNRREQQLQTARAVAEEQARVGRELHDIIAHTLSVIVVQAAAAGDVFDSSPDRARQALGSIEATGRQALAELRRVLDAIRPAASQPAPPAPQPGLAQLDALLSQVRATGLAVTLRTEGAAEDLPAGIDASAYRIVQEALTNTLKHARATTADVALVFHPQGLIIDILDDGQPASPPADGAPHPGRGIIGMHERVALYGGSLTAAPRPDGGFQVHAYFPLPAQGPPP
jgi:signal transduction histidine kinase